MQVQLTLTKEEALPGFSLSLLEIIIVTTCQLAFPKVFNRPLQVKLDVASVSLKKIAALNGEYRKKNKATDILSFGNVKTPRAVSRFRGQTLDLGQIVLAPAYIRTSAKEDGVSWKHEFVFVFSHGLLHLLGFDHSEKMFLLQDEITQELMCPKKRKTL